MNLRFRLLSLCALSLVWQSAEATQAANVPISARATELVRVTTNLGEFYVELYGNPGDSPAHVANFIQYVRDGEFVNNIFHRTVSEFVVQGGGFRVDSEDLSLSGEHVVDVATRGPVFNEYSADNGLRNTRSSVAAARLTDLNSATSQWYVNLVDNAFLDDGPYTVFGNVVQGMDVVDAIAALAHHGSDTFDGTSREITFADLPVTENGDFAVMNSVDFVTIHDSDFDDSDFDDSGFVDAADYLIWVGGFGTASGATSADGDADRDGDVDGDDFLLWQAAFSPAVVSASSGGGSLGGLTAAVPEPTSLALLVAGALAGLVAARRVR